MKNASGSVAPVLFLLSDGEPADDYQYVLNKLKKIIGIKLPPSFYLKKMIRFVAVTSSRVASTRNNAVTDDDSTLPDDNTAQVANAIQAL